VQLPGEDLLTNAGLTLQKHRDVREADLLQQTSIPSCERAPCRRLGTNGCNGRRGVTNSRCLLHILICVRVPQAQRA
jgi:hypothetical protein